MLNLKNIYLFIVLLLIVQSNGDKHQNKDHYRKNSASDKTKDQDLKSLERPFRMTKLNIAWMRAQRALNDSSLKSFYAELKHQDKEMLEWKHSEDRYDNRKEATRQAQLMFNLVMSMEKYGLLNYMDEKKIKESSVTTVKPEEV